MELGWMSPGFYKYVAPLRLVLRLAMILARNLASW
jgi:hypothetical protein